MEQVPEIPISQDADILADDTFRRLGEFFNIEKGTELYDKRDDLRTIFEWAKKASGSQEAIDILLHIRSIERELRGDPMEPRIAQLKRFIALSGEQERINKEMTLLKGENV